MLTRVTLLINHTNLSAGFVHEGTDMPKEVLAVLLVPVLVKCRRARKCGFVRKEAWEGDWVVSPASGIGLYHLLDNHVEIIPGDELLVSCRTLPQFGTRGLLKLYNQHSLAHI